MGPIVVIGIAKPFVIVRASEIGVIYSFWLSSVKWRRVLVMYESVCKLCWGEREWGENGFQIWPRINDRELVEGKA